MSKKSSREKGPVEGPAEPLALGWQIRAARAVLDISRQDLARESGVSRATIQRLETGADELDEMRPKAETLAKLAEYFAEQGIEFRVEQGRARGTMVYSIRVSVA